MTLEELYSLNDDETSMLWYIVNKIDRPAIYGIELEPSLFPSINRHWLTEKILKAKDSVQPEHLTIYESLTSKLGYIK
jgi:hypothetical protein